MIRVVKLPVGMANIDMTHIVALQDENLMDPKLVHGMIQIYFKEKKVTKIPKKSNLSFVHNIVEEHMQRERSMVPCRLN